MYRSLLLAIMVGLFIFSSGHLHIAESVIQIYRCIQSLYFIVSLNRYSSLNLYQILPALLQDGYAYRSCFYKLGNYG